MHTRLLLKTKEMEKKIPLKPKKRKEKFNPSNRFFLGTYRSVTQLAREKKKKHSATQNETVQHCDCDFYSSVGML